MQIDLLVTPKGEVGLLCDKAFDSEPSGVIYDAAEQSLSLEFSETYDSMALNIPLSEEFAGFILANRQIHFGIMEGGRVIKAGQLPLMHVNVVEDDIYY
jgi:hypothetical protein